MRKMLMAATVASMIGQFNMNNIRILQELGYEVDVACDFTDNSFWTEERIEKFKSQLKNRKVRYYQIDFSRAPMEFKKHKKSYEQVLRLMSKNNYEFVHCHTPIASVICRIAAHKLQVKCIYTAHGFHFYKGSPLKNWLLFYPIERALSRWTDVLITINREDFNIAKNKFHAKKVEYIAGVGIDRSKFSDNFTDTEQKRKELGVKNTDVMLLSVGELSVRKNHELVVRTLKKLNNPHLKYFICGEGELRQYLTDLIHQLGLKKQVRLLGYRTDVSDLCRSSDLFVFPSRQEGLPVALMEAIASKTPVVCSRIRGNTDLVQEYLIASDSVESLQNVLKPIVIGRDKLQERTRDAVERNFEGLAAFEIGNVSNNMSNIYKNMHLET